MLKVFIVRGLPFIGFKVRVPFTRKTFVALDGLGFHAGFRGHDVAWTRGFGWVLG